MRAGHSTRPRGSRRERRVARLSAAVAALAGRTSLTGVVGGVALAALTVGSWAPSESSLSSVLRPPGSLRALLPGRVARTSAHRPRAALRLGRSATQEVTGERGARVALAAEGDEDYLPWEEDDADDEYNEVERVAAASEPKEVSLEPKEGDLSPQHQAVLVAFVAAVREAKEQGVSAVEALRENGQFHADSEILSLALRALRLEGLPEQAIELYGSMEEETEPDVTAVTELLYAHEDAGLYAQASELLAMMKRRAITPSRLCYHSLMRMHSKLRRYPQALQILDEMRKAGVLPDVTSYELALDGIPSKRHADIKLGLVRKIENVGLEPDAAIYAHAVRACAVSGQWQQSLEYFDEMRSKGLEIDDTTVWFMLRACAQAPVFDTANQKFKEVEADPSISLSNIHYDVMINTCERAGRWAEIVSLAGRMGGRGVSPLDITSNTVISACVNLRKWDVAVNLLRTMQQNGADLDITAYSTVLGACARAEQWQEVVRLYEDIRALDNPEILGEEVARPAIAALCELGRIDDAMALYHEATEQGWLRIWRRPRFGTGPALMEARDLPPQVARVAVRAALLDATRKVDAEQDPGHAKRCALAGFSGGEPQDIIVVVEDNTVEPDTMEVEPGSVAESVQEAAREVLGPEVQLQARQEPFACIRVPASELEALLVKHVQQAVSEFSSGAQPEMQGVGSESPGSI